MLVTVQLNGASLSMEVDTGATASLISDSTSYHTLWTADAAPPLQPSDVKLRTYTRLTIDVLGSVNVAVTFGTQHANLSLLVISGSGPSLFGRDWLAEIRLNWNRAAHLDTYPLPRIDDLFASLSGGKKFTKLDLAHAYQQVPLDVESKQLVVINTQKGLFRYTQLPFGIASTPAIFQRMMEGILWGIPHVCVYIDDILIMGRDDLEHLQTLDTVLLRLQSAGMRLKKAKCEYLKPSVEYLGHVISAEGLSPTQKKVRAIAEAPAPQDVSQLCSFLGMVNYYSKFLPNLSSTLSPHYRLLKNKTPWSWGNEQKKAFQEAKAQLTLSCLLVHFDPRKQVILS